MPARAQYSINLKHRRSVPYPVVAVFVSSAFLCLLFATSCKGGMNADTGLTLEEAIETAMKNNPRIAAARWKARAAKARTGKATAERKGTLSFRATAGQTYEGQRLMPFRGPGDTSVFTRHPANADLVFEFPIYTGGRLRLRQSAAELLQTSQRHELGRTRKEVAFNVLSIYEQILAADKIVDSLRFSRKALEEHARRTKELLKAGKAARVDLLRTRVRLSDVEQQISQELNERFVLLRTLENVMGIDHPLKMEDLSGELVYERRDSFSPEDRSTFITEALAHRDDVIAARAKVSSLEHSLCASRAAWRPKVSLQASYGARWAIDTTAEQPGGSSSERAGFFGIAVSLPILDGRRIASDSELTRAELEAARATLRQAELQARLDVDRALSNLSSLEDRLKVTELSVRQAKESLQIERNKYELGKGSIVEVLDAQAELLKVETTRYRLIASMITARAELRLACGKFPLDLREDGQETQPAGLTNKNADTAASQSAAGVSINPGKVEHE